MKILPQPPGKSFEHRHGITAPFCQGMRRLGSTSIPDYMFYLIQNGRIVGNQIISRGGQGKITTGGALTGAVYAIFDDGNG